MANKGEARHPAEAAEYLDQWLAHWFGCAAVPGMAVTVRSRDGVLLDRRFGYAALDPETRLGVRHRFCVASQTKMMTAVALGILQDRKKLSFADTLGRHVPWIKESDPAASLTIDDLLQHRAWISRDFTSAYRQFKKETRTLSPLFNRQSGIKYSNWGYAVLGSVIEHAADRPYGDVIAENIFKPLGLRKSTIGAGQDAGGIATAHMRYRGHYNAFSLEHGFGHMAPAYGLYSTPSDMSLFALTHRDLLSRQTYDRLHDPVNAVSAAGDEYESFYGRGFAGVRIGNRVFAGHSGRMNGHLSTTYAHDGLGVAVSLCMNLDTEDAVNLARGAAQALCFFHDTPDAAFRGHYRSAGSAEAMGVFETPHGIILADAKSDNPLRKTALCPRIGDGLYRIAQDSHFGYHGETVSLSGDSMNYAQGYVYKREQPARAGMVNSVHKRAIRP